MDTQPDNTEIKTRRREPNKYVVTFGNSIYPNAVVFTVIADIEKQCHLKRVSLAANKWVFEGRLSDNRDSIKLLPGPVRVERIPAPAPPRLAGYRVRFSDLDKLEHFHALAAKWSHVKTDVCGCVVRSNTGHNQGIWKRITTTAEKIDPKYTIEKVME